MPIVVALAGQKGGVGKSTIAIALAAEAVGRGIPTLLVDADPQGTCRTWGAIAAEHGHPVPTIVALDATMHRAGQLDRLAHGYELIVIDLPARLGAVQASALGVAHLVLLPSGPSGADVWSLADSAALITEAQARRPELRAAIVLTRVQGHTAMGKGARDSAASAGLPVLRTELGYRVAYGDAITSGLGVGQYDRGEAALEVRRLFDELELGGATNGKAKQASKRSGKKTPAPVAPANWDTFVKSASEPAAHLVARSPGAPVASEPIVAVAPGPGPSSDQASSALASEASSDPGARARGRVARAAGRPEPRRVAVYFPPDLGDKLAVWCAQNHRNMSDTVVDAVRQWFERPVH